MRVFFNGNPKSPECLLIGSSSDLRKLGQSLRTLNTEFFYRSKNLEPNKHYNSVLSGIHFAIEDENSDKLSMNLRGSVFVLSGNMIAMSNFGQGLINVFDETAISGAHLHYDYLDGHGLTRETNISFVVSCEN